LIELALFANLSAVNLARKKIYQFRFLLPEHGDQFLGVLVKHIDEAKKAFATEMADVAAIRFPVDDPYKLARLSGWLDADLTDGIAIMAPESPAGPRCNQLVFWERGGKLSIFSQVSQRRTVLIFVGMQQPRRRCDCGAIDRSLFGRTKRQNSHCLGNHAVT